MTAAVDAGIGPDDHRVLVFYGPGGHGKTWLQEHFRRLLRERGVTTAWLDFAPTATEDCRRFETALKRLRVQLGQELEKPFPLFDLAFRRYHELTQPGRSFDETHPDLVAESRFLDVLLTAADLMAGGLASAFYKHVVQTYGQRALLSYQTRGSHLIERIEELQPTELGDRLIACFGADLERAVWEDVSEGREGPPLEPRHRVVVLMDTYEQLYQNYSARGVAARRIDEWVRKLVDETPGVLYVITGRDELQWDEIDEEYASIVEHHRLDGLSRGDGDSALRGAGVLENDIRERMLDGASIDADEVHPYYLEVQARYYHRKKGGRDPLRLEDFGGNHVEILSRFLEHLGSDEQRVLEFLSLSRRLDAGLYGFLKEKFFSAHGVTYVQMLERSVLYASASEQGPESAAGSDSEGGELRMHALLRRYLTNRIRTDDPELFGRVHEALFEHYDALVADTPTTESGAEHEQAFLEAAHHLRQHVPDRLAEWAVQRVPHLHAAGRYDATEPVLRECIEVLEERARLELALSADAGGGDADKQEGESSPEPETPAAAEGDVGRDRVLRTFAQLCTLFADVRQAHSDLATAEEWYRTSLAMVTEIRAKTPFELADAEYELASLLVRRYEYDEAMLLYYSALERARKHGQHGYPVHYSAGIGRFLWWRGRYLEAESLLYEAWQLGRQYGFGPEYEHRAAEELGRCLLDQRRAVEALPLIEGAYHYYRETWGPHHPFAAQKGFSLARCFAKLGRMEEAESLFLEMIAIVKATSGPQHVDVAWMLPRYAEVLVESGVQDVLPRARAACEEARQIFARAFGDDHLGVGRCLKIQADAFAAERQAPLADDLYLAALPVLERTAGLAHPVTRDCLAALVANLRLRGLEVEAARYQRHLEDVDRLIPVDIRLDRFDTRRAGKEEARALSALCSQHTSLPPNGESLEVTVAELPFHPAHQLCRFTFANTTPRLSKYAIVGKTPGQDGAEPEVYALDFSNGPIYALARKSPPVLTDETVASYVRFFFDAVRGRYGRFWVVESEEEVHWQAGVSDEVLRRQRDRVRRVIEPISFWKNRESAYSVTFMCTFRDALFKDQYEVSTSPADAGLVPSSQSKGIPLGFGLCMGLDKKYPASAAPTVVDESSWSRHTIQERIQRANTLKVQGRFLEAEAILYQVAREHGPGAPSGDDVHVVVFTLVECLLDQGRALEALPLGQGLYRLFSEKVGPDQPATALVGLELARCLAHLGRMAEAEPLFLRTIETTKAMQDAQQVFVAGVALLRYAEALMASETRDAPRRARELCEEARQIFERAFGGADHPSVGRCLKVQADALAAEGQAPLAGELYLAALSLLERTAGCAHPITRECLAALVANMRLRGLEDEAAHYQRHLKDVDRLIPVDIRLDRFDTRRAGEEEARTLAALCSQHTLLPPNGEGLEVTVAELPFHPAHQLCRFTFANTTPRLSKYAIVGKTSDPDGAGPEVYALDFSNGPVYALARKSPPVLTDETVASYVRFFYDAVRGRHGRFWIVESDEEVCWQAGVSNRVLRRQRKELRRVIVPISILERRADGYTVSVMYTFRDCLSMSRVNVPLFHAVSDEITQDGMEIVMKDLCMGLDKKCHPSLMARE